MTRRCLVIAALLCLPALAGCGRRPPARAGGGGSPSGELVIFHAGSLSVPFREIARAFEAEHPAVRVLREAAGSRACARKISELHRPCDVFASADQAVIETLLIPDDAPWSIGFAANEMVLAHRKGWAHAGEFAADNWHKALLREDVRYGRSEPDSDPCGYRAVLTIRLAEKHYGVAGLAERLLSKDARYIRSKETGLLALLELGEIDCAFLYRSVAVQHGLGALLLPDEINLKEPRLAEAYAKASVEISGKRPGGTLTRRGAPITYGVTIPKDAPNPKAAEAFVTFLLRKDKGGAIMEKHGQASLVPSATATYDMLPDGLERFARRPE